MVVAEGEGTELAKGGSVTFYYAGYNFNNNSISAGTMFATNDQDIAASAKWDLSDSTAFLPVTVTLGKDKCFACDGIAYITCLTANNVKLAKPWENEIILPRFAIGYFNDCLQSSSCLILRNPRPKRQFLDQSSFRVGPFLRIFHILISVISLHVPCQIRLFGSSRSSWHGFCR